MATNSPTVQSLSVRVMIAMAAIHGTRLVLGDIKTAFLNARRVDAPEVILRAPEIDGRPVDGHWWVLVKAAYGLIDSPLQWFKSLRDRLLGHGWCPIVSDPCVFVKYGADGGVVRILMVHVDDVLAHGEGVIEELESLGYRYGKLTSVGPDGESRNGVYIGVELEWTGDGWSCHQQQFIDGMAIPPSLETIDRVQKHQDTPLPLNLGSQEENHADAQVALTPSEVRQYQSMVGSLQWLVCHTRPDLAYSTQWLASRMSSPTRFAYAMARRVMHYTKSTVSSSVFYPILDKATLYLQAWSDATWAAKMDSFRSVTGSTGGLADASGRFAPLFWSSKRQTSVSRSSGAAELKAVEDTVVTSEYVRDLVRDIMGVSLEVRVGSDSQTVIDLLHNRVACNPRDKSQVVRTYHLREQLSKPHLSLTHLSGKTIVSDELTKPTSLVRTKQLMMKSRGVTDQPVHETANCVEWHRYLKWTYPWTFLKTANIVMFPVEG